MGGLLQECDRLVLDIKVEERQGMAPLMLASMFSNSMHKEAGQQVVRLLL